jgi:outer membrane murein-binding lipoprotein Lpp
MNGKRSITTWLLIAMMFLSGIALSGCATKRQFTDLEAKVDQALSEAQSAQAKATDATAQAKEAEAAAVRAEQAATSADNSASRAEAMANKAEAVFMQKMKK